ncbi:MAG TPA: exodeoxyribonuclease VII large subunit [Gammaproteobacteria bacterium]
MSDLFSAAATPPTREIYSVSRLNREARALLEGHFPLMWIEGEISNLSRPASGHLYFSLKDPFAQVRCAMFRMRGMHLAFRPTDGMQVLLRARLSLYEPRGDYQLIVEHMEEAGDGALRRAFEQLKQRLLGEGLFDSARKRPLPALPRCIGVVTSPSGAAIHDILTVLRRRFPAIPVIVYPVLVQGAVAAEQIAAMVKRAGERGDCDVLIVGRGGGSLEDLWPFNEEVVARAIAASPIPVVSAVGHEVDVTIADFVADQRAPTPSAAAEMVVPDHQEWLLRIARLHGRLAQVQQQRLRHARQTVEHLAKRLRHPGRRLFDIAQRLDELEGRLSHGWHMKARQRTAHLSHLTMRLQNRSPLHLLERLAARHAELSGRLRRAIVLRLENSSRQLSAVAAQLDAVSPLATLARGYAIVEHFPAGGLIRRYSDAASGDRISARLGQGRLICRIEETHED